VKRYTATLRPRLPLLAIDLGYSAKMPSCGFTHSGARTLRSLHFGDAINEAADLLNAAGPHCIVLEAALSTYHSPNGNPDIRGDFEKGRGWYYGPGVSTYAAALRFLSELDQRLPEKIAPIPVVEGFLSFKKTRSEHSEDARRLLSEFPTAERFAARPGSEPISPQIDGVPLILRYNRPE
jgi:hypothetical protein